MKVTNFLFPFILAFIFGLSINAQQNVADSIYTIFENSKSDTSKIRLLDELARYYLKVQLDSASVYNQKALDLYNGLEDTKLFIMLATTKGNILYENAEYHEAMKTFKNLVIRQSAVNDTKGLLNTFNSIGSCYFYLDNLDSSLVYFKNALKVHIQNEDLTGQSRSYNNIGVVLMYNARYPEAIKNLLVSAKIDEDLGDEVNAASAYNNIALLYADLNEHERAIEYYLKSLEIRRRLDLKKGLYSSLNNLGITYKNQKKYEEALRCFYEAVEIGQELGYQMGLGLTYSNIGIVLTGQQKFDQSIEYHLKARGISQVTEDSLRLAANLINLADNYRKTGKYQTALRDIQQGIAILKNSRSAISLMDAYAVQVEIYSGLGRDKQALEIYRIYSTMKDSLFNVEKAEKIEDIQTRYETAKKEKVILTLKEKTARQEKEKALADLRLANRKRWIYGLILGIVASIFLAGFIIQRNKRLALDRRDRAIIREREDGIKAVIDGQEEERQRIAKDLHDGIGQQLSGLKMAWQALHNKLSEKVPDEITTIESLTKTLDDAASDVRTISHQMMPRVLKEMGLIPALEDILEKGLGSSNIKYGFEHFGLEDRLAARIEISLFRICQELINNIIKHSGATEVSLQLFKNQNKLVLIVEDNGVGFDRGKHNEGIGLINIKSRLNTINGEVNYEPSPNTGAVATIRIPV